MGIYKGKELDGGRFACAQRLRWKTFVCSIIFQFIRNNIGEEGWEEGGWVGILDSTHFRSFDLDRDKERERSGGMERRKRRGKKKK